MSEERLAVESDLEEREQIHVLLEPVYAGETTPVSEAMLPSGGAREGE